MLRSNPWAEKPLVLAQAAQTHGIRVKIFTGAPKSTGLETAVMKTRANLWKILWQRFKWVLYMSIRKVQTATLIRFLAGKISVKPLGAWAWTMKKPLHWSRVATHSAKPMALVTLHWWARNQKVLLWKIWALAGSARMGLAKAKTQSPVALKDHGHQTPFNGTVGILTFSSNTTGRSTKAQRAQISGTL